MDRRRSIELLNKAVADELQAVHQYMYLHFTWTTRASAAVDSVQAHRHRGNGHVERLAERILFLKAKSRWHRPVRSRRSPMRQPC